MFLDEAPELFRATDGWRGLTVLWLRLRAGGNETMDERWPAKPPEVMVDGYWSRVRDPRDPAQSPTDASTWQWSANQALCTLDALRTNPVRPYSDAHLWTETFAWSADVADERVAVKAGGTIPRYEVDGVLVWSEGSEIEDQVTPLAAAGAAEFTRVGGRLGLVPGTYRAPVMTLSNVLDDAPLQFRRYRPSTELVTAVSSAAGTPALNKNIGATLYGTRMIMAARIDDVADVFDTINPTGATTTDALAVTDPVMTRIGFGRYFNGTIHRLAIFGRPEGGDWPYTMEQVYEDFQ